MCIKIFIYYIKQEHFLYTYIRVVHSMYNQELMSRPKGQLGSCWLVYILLIFSFLEVIPSFANYLIPASSHAVRPPSLYVIFIDV